MRICRFLLLISFSVTFACAVDYDLYALVNGGPSIVIGDKTFTFTNASLTGTGVFTPAAPLAPGAFTVTPLIVGNLYGFSLTGNLTATAQAPSVDQSSVDLALGYTVTTVLPFMTDIHLGLNGSCQSTGTGSCQVSVSETATTAGNVSLITPSTLVATLGSGPVQADFVSPQTFVRVTKDINVTATALGDRSSTAFATLSVVDQFISQVPEPGFYGVIASGLGGLLWFARRRKVAV